MDFMQQKALTVGGKKNQEQKGLPSQDVVERELHHYQ
jgi:hypothetical protein